MTTTTAENSLWLEALPRRRYPAVAGEETFDVAVVGGGIAGITTALLLKATGLRVAVVEAGRVGTGVSGNNTAKVSALQSTVYSKIIDKHGADAAADYAAASLAGVAQVGVLAEGIDCDLRRDPAYTYAYTEQEVAAVEAEAEAARQAGLPVHLDRGELMGVPFPVHAAVRLDDQIAFHPVKYVHGLAARVDGEGSRVFEDSRVTDFDDGEPCRVHTPTGTITADRVVIATHYPLLDRGGFFARLETTRSYCVAARLRGQRPPRGLAISAGSPSWSLSAWRDLLIVCGQSHKTGSDEGTPYQELERFARQHWDVEAITHRWSAQDVNAYDQLPMVGSYLPGSRRLFTATGFMKWGLSGSTFAAMMLADLVTDRDNPWAERFSPHRVSLRSLGSAAKMNVEVAADMVGDRLKPADTRSVEEVPRGEARVVRVGTDKVGVYRDEADGLHAVSVRCTHLGCIVRFNSAERSWDCPCHGSRFDVDGGVLEGPATEPLPRHEV
ncbi:FAD-dependent oxidoreductase [Saccharothrix coeruleofusca]|uniref:Iron-sulfur-binding protein n=1 Tax=Saccharothrix coeruleofusca TaxID=33919 RepID=A0A918AL34_9PSEU|nr:FAD-dependent oxidoreductase [Saccharothrix coeruleofusca]MBP2336233.1 glycine/D-amino acid oxidase-like deaminating enzyme/nitrite reductase/ring-hydroxylating ferredoxin subunit [Saccharothrix coeruleofusca]GGP54438.1 iron-sulfur-binding protein [Saccharothrix coeruleofusca]